MYRDNSQFKILVVDDVPQNIEIVGKILENHAYDVYISDSGKNALQIAKNTLFDLILLDIMMPEMDGFETLTRIKRIPGYQEVPVIFLTAKGDIESTVRGFELGAVDFIRKPFNPTELLVRIMAQGELKKARDDLARQREFFMRMIYSISDGVVATDEKGKIVVFNKVAEQFTGCKEEEAYRSNILDVLQIADADSGEPIMPKALKALSAGNSYRLPENCILTSLRGTTRYVTGSISRVSLQTGPREGYEYLGLIGVIHDITQEKKKLQNSTYLSYHDHLTGTYNRHFYEENLKEIDTQKNLPLTVIMADVDGLKMANDAFGHKVGDQLISQTAQFIKGSLRDEDILIRYGGDEFLIIMKKTEGKVAEKIVSRISKKIDKAMIDSFSISISFGWATKKKKEEDLNKTIKKADGKMYSNKLLAKQSNRENIVQSIVQSLYDKRSDERDHSFRVSELSVALGKALHLKETDIRELETAGLFHDIGKIAWDAALLNKAYETDLTEEETLQVRKHPETGYHILSNVEQLSETARIVLAHHENWDGSGYPKGLKGENIPYLARIIAIVDEFDVMTWHRKNKTPKSADEAIEQLIHDAGRKYDPHLVRVFVEKVLQKEWKIE